MAKSNRPADDRLVFKVADLFFQGMSVREVAEELHLTREGVYPLLAKAREREFIRLVPPVELVMSSTLAAEFHCDEARLRVVNVEGHRFGEQVAASAAELVFDLIKRLGRTGRSPIRLGLGPGRATLDFSRHLGALLRANPTVPKLRLVAISAGGPAHSPEYSPSGFFNLFPRHLVDRCVGLFAETLVPCDEFERIRLRAGVAEAFEERDEIDIVVTAMGDIDDPHDLLRMFLEKSRVDIAKLKARGWLGNVQYRPFSASGSITQKGRELRAVTLFELDDFVRLAERKNKHVVLIVRPCGQCAKGRSDVLRPLLEVPSIRVWSELVLDVGTAGGLLATRSAPRGDGPPPISRG